MLHGIIYVPKNNFIITGGQMKEFCPLISDLFFPDTYGWFLIFDQSFQKPKGGPLDEKYLKKLDFYVWYLKRTALKNVDWKWNRFLKILIFVEVMDRKVPNAWNPHICSKCLFFGTFKSTTSTKINIFINRFHFQSTFFMAVLLRYQT